MHNLLLYNYNSPFTNRKLQKFIVSNLSGVWCECVYGKIYCKSFFRQNLHFAPMKYSCIFGIAICKQMWVVCNAIDSVHNNGSVAKVSTIFNCNFVVANTTTTAIRLLWFSIVVDIFRHLCDIHSYNLAKTSTSHFEHFADLATRCFIYRIRATAATIATSS